MSKRIAIMGVGAAGSYIGAYLTKSGYDVTLIDMWGEHVEMMNRDGLNVSDSDGTFTVPVNAVHLSDAEYLYSPFDIIFLAVKSYDTEWATYFIKRFLSHDGVIVSAQNCMNDGLIASIVGYERELGCVMSSITVSLWEPGNVNRKLVDLNRSKPSGTRSEYTVFRVGELHGRITSRVEEITEILSTVDNAKATSNIWGERWSKLTTNACGNPVTAMTGLGSKSIAQDAKARLIQIHIAKETSIVGLASGFQIETVQGVSADVWSKADDGSVYEELDAILSAGAKASDWKSSMAQDVSKGRRTEIDFMNGHIVEMGRRLGISTPINKAIVNMVQRIDSGEIAAHPSNIDSVLIESGLPFQ